MPVVTTDQLRGLGMRIFTAAGTPEDLATTLVDHLVNANLTGHDSHGVIRIPSYVQAIQRGNITPSARPAILRETASTALVDGNWAFGQISARFGTEVAIRKAKQAGLALVGVVRCNHIGRVGEYVTIAAAQDVVAMVTVASPGGTSVAPYGGKAGALGTNPLAIGFPADRYPDLMVDFATSAIAGGKVMVARAKREPVPQGCLLDRDGNPTTDPEEYFNGGMLLPFGGHKGYALSLVVALFSSVLTGAESYANGGNQSGTFILTIDAGVFRPVEDLKQSADRVFERIKAVPPRDGFDEVLIPGEIEAANRERRAREGIPVPEATWNAIKEAAASVGVTIE